MTTKYIVVKEKRKKRRRAVKPISGFIRPVVGAAVGITLLGATAGAIKSMQK